MGAAKADVENLRHEMREMEGRINERIDLKVESSEYRVIAALERSHGDLRKDMVAQTRVFVFSTLTAVVAVGGLAVTAARFG